MFRFDLKQRAKEQLAGITFRWRRLELSDLRLIIPLVLATLGWIGFAWLVRIDWPEPRHAFQQDASLVVLSGELTSEVAELVDRA